MLISIRGRPRLKIRLILYIIITICFTILFYQWIKPKHSIIYIKGDDSTSVPPFDTKTVKYIPEETIIQNYKSMMIELPSEDIDWSKLAYVFYSTHPDKLLPVLFNVRQLRRLRTRANIEIICSFQYEGKKDIANIIKLLKERYLVTIHVVEPIRSKFHSDSTNWIESFTKLYAFNLTHLDRIIYMDADAMIRKNMDQLFFLPPAMLALPINYIDYKDAKSVAYSDIPPPSPLEYSLWEQKFYKEKIENEEQFNSEYFWSFYEQLPMMELTIDTNEDLKLASYMMVIIPDEDIFQWILKTIGKKREEEYDMEIINKIWNPSKLLNGNYYNRDMKMDLMKSSNKWLNEKLVPSLLIIPHTSYALLSGEFRHTLFQHSAYLASPNELWNLFEGDNCLSIQRAVNEGVSYKTIEDIIDTFPNVPFWDWAWRFDIEGQATEELYIGDEMRGRERREDGLASGRNPLVGVSVDKFGWKSDKILKDAFYLHWSDWPLNKPWEMFGENENENENENGYWLMDKMANESLESCLRDSEMIFDSFQSRNEEIYVKNKIYFDREREFAIRVCHESIDTWKEVYQEYKILLQNLREEIRNVN